MIRKFTVAVLAAAVTLTGCAEGGGVRNQDAGAVVGGVLGGVLGSNVGKGSGRTAAIIAGTLAGAVIGGKVGQYMDEQDRMKAQQALETTRTGEPVAWRNPDTNARYEMTPTRTYQTADSGPCRDYTMDAWIEGRKEVVTGTACRQADGTWKTM